MNRRAAVAALFALSVMPGADGRARADDARIPDEQIAVVSNVRYRDKGPVACVLDIAVPKDHSGPRRPAIVVIHGGGWIEGDKSSFSTMTNRVPGNIIDFAGAGSSPPRSITGCRARRRFRPGSTIAAPRSAGCGLMPTTIISTRRASAPGATRPAGIWPCSWR